MRGGLHTLSTCEKEEAHLSRSLSPDHFSDGGEVFTITPDSWKREVGLMSCLYQAAYSNQKQQSQPASSRSVRGVWQRM